MDIGIEVSKLLKLFGSNEVTDEQARLVSGAAAEALLGTADAEDILGPAAGTSVALQQAYAGVVAIFAEAARHKLSAADLKCADAKAGSSRIGRAIAPPLLFGEGVLVDDQRLIAGRAAVITEAYEKNSSALRAQLEQIADAGPVPRLAGSSWRADYTVATSEDRAAASMVFHVALRTSKTAAQLAGPVNTSGQEIRFAMGVEQLAAFHEKLREAIHAADSLAASAKK